MNASALPQTSAPAPGDELPPPRFDFPTWLPPMLVKELRQGLRTRGFVGSLIGFHVLMIAALTWAFAIDVGGQSRSVDTVNNIFWTLLGVLLLGVTPLRALFGLSNELNARTIDLLVLSRLTAWRIVQGKWVSLVAQALLLVIAMLPYGLVRYFFGSVDLLADLTKIGALLLTSAVLTAAGLWFSALPRLVRFALPVATAFLVPATASFLFGRSMFFSPRATPSEAWVWTGMIAFNAAVVLVFFLIQAVRRVAPPAENHCPATRAIALVQLLLVAPLHYWGPKESGFIQFALSMVAILLVCTIEVASLARPMASHVRPWWRRGGIGKLVGRAVLPGWPSAAAFAFVAVGALIAMAALIGFPPVKESARFLWALALVWPAIIAPMLVVALVPSAARVAPAIYFIIQGVFGIISIVGANTNGTQLDNPVAQFLETMCHIIPVSSFWIALTEMKATLSTEMFVAQGAMFLAVLIGAAALSRGYWRGVRTRATPPTEKVS